MEAPHSRLGGAAPVVARWYARAGAIFRTSAALDAYDMLKHVLCPFLRVIWTRFCCCGENLLPGWGAWQLNREVLLFDYLRP